MDMFLTIFIKSVWCGIAALGFGVLFNTPPRSLLAIWFGGFSAGFVKYGTMTLFPEMGIIMSSFLAALIVGFTSIPMAHWRHVPPVIFSIPSVIPLVPGIYAYRAMLGLMQLTRAGNEKFGEVAQSTVYNAVTTFFVVMVLALGVVLPMYLLRKESVKKIRWGNW
ncbi:MAG: threonine/serine exporter family protein [Cyclobacteriaceae bacterium]|nr:threonine/serine exporter family protein [Cyclobacteriaceae bacterium]